MREFIDNNGIRHVFQDLVRNTKTGEEGLVIKSCPKSVKVLIRHQTIRGAHDYRYWNTIELIKTIEL